MATVPDLARLDRVELAHAGTWHLALGGEQTFTGDDFAAAVAALDCPAVTRPIVKLGHFDSRTSGYKQMGSEPGDGEPALGWIANMGLTRDRNGLIGDLVGMPGWLGAVAASAYPSRSIEGCRNYVCPIGHKHPFVLSAVALLGVTPPAIGTLGSLQDHVRALYGVAAAETTDSVTGEPFAVTFTAAAEEASVPETRADLVAAAATVDELRTAYHQTAPYDVWIAEIQLNPLQLIVTSDGGNTYRVPVTVGADNDSFTFGPMVPVEVTYVDDTADQTVAAAAGPRPLAVRFASRAESRPTPVAAADTPQDPPQPTGAPIPQTDPTQAPTVPPAPAQPVVPNVQPEPPAPAGPAAEPETSTTTEEGDDMSLSEIASRLGLDGGSDKDAILAALDEKLKPPTPDPVAVAASAQRDQQFAAALEQIQGMSTELSQIKAEKAQQAKDSFFAAAVQQGKIRPADRAAWEARYDKAPDVITDIVGAMAAGSAVPVTTAGYVGDPEPSFDDSDLMGLLPPSMVDSMKGGN